MSFKRILVAIDESPLASFVFEQALTLAEQQNTTCNVFHCIDSAGLSHYAPMLSLKSAEEKIQQLLQRYQEKAKTWNVSAEFSYEVGEPGRAICDVAQQWGAELIVVGRRGNRGLTEMLLGSVSNHVIHHAPCSVLVMQGDVFDEELAAADRARSASIKSSLLS